MRLTSEQLKGFHKLSVYLAGLLPAGADGEGASFASLAGRLDLGGYWKADGEPATSVATLLAATFSNRRELFVELLLKIVVAAAARRKKEGRPFTHSDIRDVNTLLGQVGVKIAIFHHPTFLKCLGLAPEAPETTAQRPNLEILREGYYGLSCVDEGQTKGMMLEYFLGTLFGHFKIQVSQPFVAGDGCVEGTVILGGCDFPVEARWVDRPPTAAELLSFGGRVGGEGPDSVGIFLSLTGITREADDEMGLMEQTNMIVVSGYDLSLIVEGRIGLKPLLQGKLRHLRESGAIHVPGNEIVE